MTLTKQRGRGGWDGAEVDETGDYIVIQQQTGTQTAIRKKDAYRRLRAIVDGGQVTNDGTDAETVTISVVDGLEVSRGTDPSNATVLDYDGEVRISIDGVETTKTLSNGTVSFDLTTEKPAGNTITVTAESLADHPADSDTVTIEVVSA